MGRAKVRVRDDWEIVYQKVVQKVEKLCKVVFAHFVATVTSLLPRHLG